MHGPFSIAMLNYQRVTYSNMFQEVLMIYFEVLGHSTVNYAKRSRIENPLRRFALAASSSIILDNPHRSC